MDLPVIVSNSAIALQERYLIAHLTRLTYSQEKPSLFLLLGFGVLLLNLCMACTPSRDSSDQNVYGSLQYKIKTLDPIGSSDRYSTQIVSQVYEGLYHYHYLKRPIELEPAIADGMPEISDDGKTYTIRLKSNVYFQDDPAFPGGKGREVHAKDFIYSWKRLADPVNKSPGFWILDDRVVGLNQWRDQMSKGQVDYNSPIPGLSAPDEKTLVIRLKKPFFQLPHLLALPFAMVVPQEAVNKYGTKFSDNPVGSGPFRLKKWTRGSKIHLSRHLRFRESLYPSAGTPEDQKRGRLADSGKRLPLSDNVIIRIITERQPMWLTFMKGNLDYVVLPKENFPDLVKFGKRTPEMIEKNIQFHYYPRLDLSFVGMNMEHPLLGKNKKLRKAIAKAYDTKTALIQIFNNRGFLAQGPIPPNLEGHDPEFVNDIQYDLTAAKALLVEAGFPLGKGLPEFTYDMASQNSTSRQIAEYFKIQMDKIGVKVRLVSNSFPQFDKKVKSKKVELFGMGWYADYPDAENFLQLFYSKNISPGPNMTNYQNREYDKLYEKAASLKPGPQREALYKKMNRFIAQETPMFFNIHTKHFLPHHGWLKNYKENSTINDFYRYLRVDPKQRNEQKARL